MGRWRSVFVSLTCIAGALLCVGSASPRAETSGPPLPNWIREISPHGSVDTLAQIRVLFVDPVIPLEAVESPDRQTKLRYFHVQPALSGHFIFLTPRMVGFQMDRALPLATHITVTLDRGLGDLNGHSLASDLSWSFETTPIQIETYPNTSGISLDPAISLISNTQLDIESLRQHTTLTGAGGSVALDIRHDRDEAYWGAWPGTVFDPSLRRWYYSVKVRQALAKSTDYKFTVARGVKPAAGNMPSASDFSSSFRTYDPLRFEGLDVSGQSLVLGTRYGDLSLQLVFNNSLDPKTTLEHISISPQPAGPDPVFQPLRSDRGVDIVVDRLDPRTTYTFTMDPDVTDTFGQKLGRRAVTHYTTGDLNPDFWSISDHHIFAPALGIRLNLIARNLPNDRYQVAYRVLNPLDVADPNASHLLPDSKTWSDVRLRIPANRTEDVTLPLSALLGGHNGALAYGLAAKFPGYDKGDVWGWNGGHPIPVFGIAQVTDLGLYVQETPDAGFVRTQSLSKGEAVGGASVDVYALSGGNETKFAATPCASAMTDPLGTALLTGADWLRCVKTIANQWGAPVLLVVARTASGWTFVRTDTGAALGSGWERGRSSRGAMFTDRDLYQPGETVQFTGIAYYEEAGATHRDANSRYTLTLQSPDGSSSSLGTTTTDEFGAFAFRVPLKASQTVGSYQVTAKEGRGLQIGGRFTVAQFTPPNFEVHLSVDKAVAFQSEAVGLESASKYLFGVPLSNAKTAFHATRSQTQYSPPGWDGYSFGRTWWWIDTAPRALDSSALDVTSQVDSQGRARATIRVPADLPYPVQYQVDATTTDVSNRSVADSGSFVALPSDALIGLQGPWTARAGEPISIRTIVVDHNGKTLPGRGVTAVLARIDYGDEGGSAPHYVTVDTQTATSGSAAVAMPLTAPSAGTYRIQANFAGSTNEATATDTFVWVSGPGQVDWGKDDNSGLTIRLDKKKYHAGDTATAVIEAPFVPADLYLSVVKHGLLYHTVVQVTGSAPEARFTVTPQMLPNSEIEAVLVRKGTPLSKATAKTQGDIVRYGSVALMQDLDDRYLHVVPTPVHATIGPGKTQTITFDVTDIKGRPARAEIAVMVVNDDILQMTGYRPPDLVGYVYAGQQISSVVVDDRAAMLFAQPDETSQVYYGREFGRLSSFGGAPVMSKAADEMAAPSAAKSVYIRTNFKKLAFYDLAVRTDANGKASVTFKMPDDLTRWRVFAEASGAVTNSDDADYRFGYGESTFVATKPLLTNPLLPQFARPGDVFDGGLSVTSGTGATGMLSIKGALNGPLSFAGGHATNSLDVAMRSGTQAYRFPITVSKVAPATIQFTTLLGQESDAFRVPLALTPLEITEQVIDSGATTTGARIPLRVDPKVDDRAGGLQVSIASTLLPQITVPAEQMLAEPCLPFLTEAAAQLSAAADMQMIADRYGQRFPNLDLRAIATRNLEIFEKLQRPDSGFADWPGATWRDPYSNAYAAEALARAQHAGFHVAPSFIDSAKTILRAAEKDPEPFAPLCDEPCLESIRLHALVGLAALGETHTANLPAVYAQRDNFGYVDRLLLARYLSAIPAWKTQAGALAVKLAETIYETGRYATVNQSESSWWWWSGTESQAQAIRLYSSRPASADFRDRLVRGLLAQRRKGAWANTFDTAEALDALVDYLALESSPPKFDATASVAGRTVVATRFEGYREPLRETNIGMASLPRGLSNVDLQKTGTGTLHYVIAYRYRLQGAQPGAMEGIRIDRKLHPVNGQSVLATIGVVAHSKPLTLPPGQVYDVELVIVADHPLDQVVITDPLPAGMEAVDSSFKTATPYFQPLASAWNIDYTQIYRDRVVAFADRLGPGVYSFHYLVRTVTPGTFLWPGADAHLEFAPEQFGRTASSTLRVSM